MLTTGTTRTVGVDADKTVVVIVRSKDLGRPRVIEGAETVQGPAGPYRSVGGYRQFDFVPQRAGTAVIEAQSRTSAATARLVLHIVCP